MLPVSASRALQTEIMDPEMNLLTKLDIARERDAAAALSSHYQKIGSAAILAAVLALTRQRELLASASQTAKKAA